MIETVYAGREQEDARLPVESSEEWERRMYGRVRVNSLPSVYRCMDCGTTDPQKHISPGYRDCHAKWWAETRNPSG